MRSFILMVCLLSCGCTKTKSTDDLLADLKSAEEKDRITAVRLLPERRADGGRVVPALIESLQDKQANIRRSAAIGLGSLGQEARDAISALQAAQSDPDARVREAAGVALSRIDPQRFPAPSKTRAAAPIKDQAATQ
jgi:hypothetical protein